MDATINYEDAYEIGEGQNSVSLTMKNYEKKAGFSFRPFDSPENMGNFELTGPIGKGLGIDN